MEIKRKVSNHLFIIACFVWLTTMTLFPDTMYAEQVITKVFEDIYTITKGAVLDSNTTFIVSDDGVLVIDTRVNHEEALKVLLEIRKVTAKPIKYVINTHFHGDHVFGNQIFAEASSIIAHKNVRIFLEEKTGEEHLALLKKLGVPGLEDTKIIIPDVTYEKSLDIILGQFDVQLKYLGRGHTNSDSVIYLPEKKILITGDLVFNEKIPFAGHAYIAEWIERLGELEKIDADIVIPGHGDVGDKTIIKKMTTYLTDLKNAVMETVKKGKSLEECKTEVKAKMEKYKTWKNFSWLDGNIEIAYQEFSKK